MIVNLNTATLEQLETLPGVGPVLSQDILDWRDAHGEFTSIDQLQDVSGIGPAKFAEIKALGVAVTGDPLRPPILCARHRSCADTPAVARESAQDRFAQPRPLVTP